MRDWAVWVLCGDAEASRVRMCRGLLQAGTSLAGSISDGVLRSID